MTDPLALLVLVFFSNSINDRDTTHVVISEFSLSDVCFCLVFPFRKYLRYIWDVRSGEQKCYWTDRQVQGCLYPTYSLRLALVNDRTVQTLQTICT